MRISFWAALALCAALIVAPWRGHVDDTDAQLYLVLERTMARAHEWIDLRVLPGFYPRFREHLPFAFWPGIAAIRVFGEWAVNPLNALFSLLALIVTGRIASRLAGPGAAVAAIVLLGTCESYWQYGGRPLVEPLLFLTATAAAAAALEDRWLAAGLLGALAMLVKGPFGLLPLGCVALAKLSWRGCLAAGLAIAPFALFIFLDPAGGWRATYLHDRLLGLTAGTVNNGIVMWWFPVSVILRRFWPGLPFLIWGLICAVRHKPLRPLAIACVLMVAALCVPERKWGNHTYVAFPLLAALAGAAIGRSFEKLPRPVLPALACIAWALSLSGVLARVLPPPCVFSTSRSLDALHAGQPILVVAPQPDTLAISELAAERDLVPWPVSTLPAQADVHYAAVHDGIAIQPPWEVLEHAAPWSITAVSRIPATPSAQ